MVSFSWKINNNSIAGYQFFSGRIAEDYTLKPWLTIGSLNQGRAFASVVTIEIEFNNTIMYILGGYSKESGFLNSVEKYDKSDGSFSNMDSLQLKESKSHFCTILTEVKLTTI